MAATTSPTSPWAETYHDKSDEWVLARLENFEAKEKLSVAGSIPRRKEIRLLRVERDNRKKAALAAAEGAAASGAVPAPPNAPPVAPPERVAATPRLTAS